MAAACALAMIQGIEIFTGRLSRPAGRSKRIFTRKVRTGSGICCCHVANSNRRKPKIRLRDIHAEWREDPVFLAEAYCFGIIKGEQPLIRGSSASKSLVIFWFSFVIKREHIPEAILNRNLTEQQT